MTDASSIAEHLAYSPNSAINLIPITFATQCRAISYADLYYAVNVYTNCTRRPSVVRRCVRRRPNHGYSLTTRPAGILLKQQGRRMHPPTHPAPGNSKRRCIITCPWSGSCALCPFAGSMCGLIFGPGQPPVVFVFALCGLWHAHGVDQRKSALLPHPP